MKQSVFKASPRASAPTHNDISQCARELWTQWGQPTGRDEAIWLEAESRLNDACRNAAAPAVNRRSPAAVTFIDLPAQKTATVALRAAGRVASKPASDRPLPAGLSGSNLRTYQTIFQHPVSHNLHWQDVHALFRRLGQVDEKRNGSFVVTRNGQSLTLPAPRTKDVGEPDEVIKIRHFLERSEPLGPDTNEATDRCFVIVNHHEIRIFHSILRGTASEQFLPHDPADSFRPAAHAGDFSRGREKPDASSYFEPVAERLSRAQQILIFGSGTGTSSEMDQFVAWLNVHHPELARRVVGAQVVDEHHLTDGQLLAKARDFYAAPDEVQIATD
ncbi:MAG: DUF2934 domain-containing protein [Opitutaceae bacterium]